MECSIDRCPPQLESKMGNCSCTGAGATATANAFDIKKSIRKDPALMEITEKFLASVLPAVKHSLADLGRCLELAHFRLEPIYAAAILFEKKNGFRRRRMKKKLHEFKMASGDVFASLNPQELQSVLEQLQTLMAGLRRRKETIRARIRSTKRWRKAWNALFTAAFVAVLACSVTLAALAVLPLLAIPAASAATTAMKAVSELGINHLLDEREKKLEEEKEVVEALRSGGFSLRKLESIHAVAEKLRDDYDELQKDVEFVLHREEDENAVEVGMVAIKEKVEVKGAAGIRSDILCLKSKVEAFIDEIGRVEDEFLVFIRD